MIHGGLNKDNIIEDNKNNVLEENKDHILEDNEGNIHEDNVIEDIKIMSWKIQRSHHGRKR